MDLMLKFLSGKLVSFRQKLDVLVELRYLRFRVSEGILNCWITGIYEI